MEAFQQTVWRSWWIPCTVVICMSLMKTFLKFCLQLIIFKSPVLFSSAVISCWPSSFSFGLMGKLIVASARSLIDTDWQTSKRLRNARWLRCTTEICESEEFLSHIGADQLISLLNRDDLSAPPETFVFKSVMQWIKYKKEERMPVAAKVIGAVRLGLVEIRDVIRQLNTEEMKRVPEIFMLLHESMLYSYIPSSSTFAEEKAKLRSTGPVRAVVIYSHFPI